MILHKEDEQYLGSALVLSTSEKLANDHLMSFKRQEILNVFNNHNSTIPAVFPPSQNFLNSKPLILQSEVFRFIRNMPKGSCTDIMFVKYKYFSHSRLFLCLSLKS